MFENETIISAFFYMKSLNILSQAEEGKIAAVFNRNKNYIFSLFYKKFKLKDPPLKAEQLHMWNNVNQLYNSR